MGHGFTNRLMFCGILLSLLPGCIIPLSHTNSRTANPNSMPAQSQEEIPLEAQLRHFSTLYSVLDAQYDFVNQKPLDNDPANLLRLYPIDLNSKLALLGSGADFLAARMQLLDVAQKSVRIHALSMRGDEAGWTIADKLIELRAKGLVVKVVIDSLASMNKEDQTLFFRLMQNNIEVEGFELPYLGVFSEVGNDDGAFEIAKLINHRRHEKLFIVDAEIPEKATAILGGTNLANKYYRISTANPQADMWRDKDVIVKGPIVATMAQTFDRIEGEIVEFKKSHALLNLEPLWNLIIKFRESFGMNPLVKLPTPKHDVALLQKVNDIAKMPLNLKFLPAPMRFLRGSPKKGEEIIFKAYMDSFKRATKEIIIANSYFVPTVDMQDVLVAAAKRGVAVRIMTNAPEISDFETVQVAARRIFVTLLGVNSSLTDVQPKLQVFEWGGDQVFDNGEGLHHAKYAIIDRRLVIVGSYNLDPRSRHLNSESVLVFEQPELAEDLYQEFLADTKPEFSRNVSYADAKKFNDPSGLLKLLRQRFSEAIEPFL